MANRLPTALPRRPTLSFLYPTTSTTATTTTARYRLCARPPTMLGTASTPFSQTPARHATIIRRPRRPYEFTQLVQLSDGSTYTRRTASPLALYRSTKDSRNHVLWQPSEKTLRNVEVDEAGRLAAFRGRFGRGWDAEARAEDDKKGEGEGEGEGESEGEEVARAGAGAGAKDGDGDAKDGGAADDTSAAAAAAGGKEKGRERKGAAADTSSAGGSLGDLLSGYSKPEKEIKEKAPTRKKK